MQIYTNHFEISMVRQIIFSLLAVASVLSVRAADPTSTRYNAVQCQGSAMPYPDPAMPRVIPDSLTPVFLNHVGRHGARFYSSSKFTTATLRMLDRADSLRTITPVGKELKALCRRIINVTAGRWGALDSLGMAEQRAIASRTFTAFRPLFSGTKISAISSYVPRCIASMDEFTHQLARLDNKIEIYTSSGRQNNSLMRPWTDDVEYKDFMASDGWHKVYDEWFDKNTSPAIAARLLGAMPLAEGEDKDFAMNVYKIVAGCASIGISVDASKFLTSEEYNSLWSIENLHHYLTHSASTLSQAPMDLAARLLLNLIDTFQQAVDGNSTYSVMLRFGHAETLMPLLAIMRLKGCYYMTNYFDTVGQHWMDFHVVPMAANLQMSLLRSKTSGTLYLRVDLNENPVPLIPGRQEIYTPWPQAREYLNRCLPLIMQE